MAAGRNCGGVQDHVRCEPETEEGQMACCIILDGQETNGYFRTC